MKWFSKRPWDELNIGVREKALILGLVIVACGFVGFRLVIAPGIKSATRMRAQHQQVESELIRLEVEGHTVEEQQAIVEERQRTMAQLSEVLETLEEGLLNQQNLHVLLEKIMVEARQMRLLINEVKPIQKSGRQQQRADVSETPSASEFYEKRIIQIDTYTTYDRLIEYIEMLDRQRQYQRVHGVKVKIEGRDLPRPRGLIMLETLLATTPEKGAAHQVAASVSQDTAVDRGPSTQDPFLTREKPKEEEEAAGLQLSGIFGEGSSLTALINGDAYQMGDLIGGMRVVSIGQERVVLERGAKRFLLYVGGKQ